MARYRHTKYPQLASQIVRSSGRCYRRIKSNKIALAMCFPILHKTVQVPESHLPGLQQQLEKVEIIVNFRFPNVCSADQVTRQVGFQIAKLIYLYQYVQVFNQTKEASSSSKQASPSSSSFSQGNKCRSKLKSRTYLILREQAPYLASYC